MNQFRRQTIRRCFRPLPPALLLALLLTGLIATAAQAQACVPLPPFANDADRIGFNVVTDEGKSVFDYDADYFGAGWFIDYRPSQFTGATDAARASATEQLQPAAPAAVNPIMLPLVQTVQPNMHSMAYLHLLRGNDLDGDWQTLVGNLVNRYPGLLLVVGNEPDRGGLQDNMPPDVYARIYHDVYAFVKQRDPAAQVAVAGVVQPTPLRLAYLDRVLDEYRTQFGHEMPVDVWTVHAFILRELDPADAENEFENWGAGIPPGMQDKKDLGIRYDVPDHGDINIFKQNITDFRKWMKWRGYRNTPLIVTEYGILMRPDYEAPPDPVTGQPRVYDHDFVRDYMYATFDFFRTAADADFGYPADSNHLVQSWSWFALNNDVETDSLVCCNGNLANHETGSFTPLGQDFAAYTANLGANLAYADLNVRAASTDPVSLSANTAGQSLTVYYALTNRGNERAPGARMRFWLGDPDNGGQLLAGQPVSGWLSPRCRQLYEGEASVTIPALPPGAHTLTVQVLNAATAGAADPVPANNRLTVPFQISAPFTQPEH